MFLEVYKKKKKKSNRSKEFGIKVFIYKVIFSFVFLLLRWLKEYISWKKCRVLKVKGEWYFRVKFLKRLLLDY